MNSSYFWLPLSKLGNGIGNAFLLSIFRLFKLNSAIVTTNTMFIWSAYY